MKLLCLRLLFVALAMPAAWADPSAVCQASPQIRREIQQAGLAPVSNPADFDHNIAPYQSLRERHAADLFVHERYQDAVAEYGIEGHLRVLTQEYQQLSAEHPGDVMYQYLSARALIGRSTRSAVAALNDILAAEPDFGPAQGSLAEIYSSEAFRDKDKENLERQKFLALCPGGTITARPGPLPSSTKLIDQAEELLAGNGDPNRIADMAGQGIREEEWRLQRARPFDWYSVAFKQGILREVKADYWRVWSIQVRCYRISGQAGKAGELLDTMEQRARALPDNSVSDYWQAQVSLARLYLEGNEASQATQKLAALTQSLNAHPDPGHAAQLEALQKLMRGQDK